MVVYSRARQPMVLCLSVFGIALVAVTGYLIYLTVYRHAKLNDNIQHTCTRVGDPRGIYTDTINHGVVVVSDYIVEITSDDAYDGLRGECWIDSACTSYHYSFMSVQCDTYVLPPKLVTCWTNPSDTEPVCVEPGSDWIAAMIGTIITAVIGISLFLCVVCIKRDIKRRPSMTEDDVVEFVAVPNTSVIVVAPYAIAQSQPANVPVVPGVLTAQVVSQPTPKLSEDNGAKPNAV